MRLSDETMDGLMLEWRLAADPQVTARRNAYWQRVKEDRERIKHLDADALISALKAHCPAYIEDLLRKKPLDDLQDRVVMTMQGKGNRERLSALLGIS